MTSAHFAHIGAQAIFYYTLKPYILLTICYALCASFFQAEDGIRYSSVTGVQTCAFSFSSRRRHTRFKCDWSSDVCSSDLRPRAIAGHGVLVDRDADLLQRRFGGLARQLPGAQVDHAQMAVRADRKSVV